MPILRVAMAVEDAQDSHFRFADYIEDAVEEAVKQGPMNFLVNLGISGRVLSDSLQGVIGRSAEL